MRWCFLGGRTDGRKEGDDAAASAPILGEPDRIGGFLTAKSSPNPERNPFSSSPNTSDTSTPLLASASLCVSFTGSQFLGIAVCHKRDPLVPSAPFFTCFFCPPVAPGSVLTSGHGVSPREVSREVSRVASRRGQPVPAVRLPAVSAGAPACGDSGVLLPSERRV